MGQMYPHLYLCQASRRFSRLEEINYQAYSPIGLDLKPLERALGGPPEDPLGIAAERIGFRVSSGVISPALGPAL